MDIGLRDMKLLKMGRRTAEIRRNKRKGRKLIIKWTHPDRASHRCIWCCLLADCNVHYKPCDDFLPEHIFFIDEDKNNKRWKISRGEKK